MKKVGIIALVLVLVLGFGAMLAYAKAQRIVLEPKDPGVEVLGASGWAIVNEDANGRTIVVVQVRDLTPETPYWVWSNGSRGKFMTNRAGNGHFQFKLAGFDGRIRVRTGNTAGANRVLWSGP